MTALVTLREFARQRNVNPGQASRWKQRGLLVISTLPDGTERVDLDASNAAIDEFRDPSRVHVAEMAGIKRAARIPTAVPGGRTVVPKGNPDQGAVHTPQAGAFQNAKTVKAVFEAKMEQLNYEKAKGELVNRERVKSVAFKLGRMLRDNMLGLPTRVAPELATLTDSFEIERRLRDAIRQVFVDHTKLTLDDLDRAMEPDR